MEFVKVLETTIGTLPRNRHSKFGELLEKPEEVNQQPRLSLNDLIGFND